MAETLVKSVPATATGLVLSAPPGGGVGVERQGWCGWWRCSGILLGPEGISPCWVVVSGYPVLVIKLLSLWGWCVVAVGSGWSLFENCTVDASIFAMHTPGWGCVLC